MKYLATISLFAAAVLWSSASARPHHNPDQSTYIDDFTAGVISRIEDKMPEPHKTILINKVHEAHRKHWDNFEEYLDYIMSMLKDYARESGIKPSRRRRDIDSNEEFSSDEIANTHVFYEAYARILAWMAPPAHQAALLKKYEKALLEDYKNFDEYEVEAIKIFEEETGLDFKKLEAEYGEEKFAELGEKLVAEFGDLLATANSEETNSSEED